MKKLFVALITALSIHVSIAQGNSADYYYQIPEAPEAYTPGTVAARLVDGLGFRYYWGTEGLRPEDLLYRPSDSARNVIETIDHVHGLTQVLLNAVNERPHESVDLEDLAFSEKRELTLENIQQASDILKNANAGDLEKFNMVFSSRNEFPFWNLINGPIADAINHVGQVITFRRTNGNQIYQKISVLRGKVYE